MKTDQFSLGKLLVFVAVVGSTLGLIAGVVRLTNQRIWESQRDGMRQAIIENEIEDASRYPALLNSESARTLLGDEIETLKAERQRRIDAKESK